MSRPRPSTSPALHAAVLLSILLAGGCAQYEYVVVQPEEFAGRLTRQERVIEPEAGGPLAYHIVDHARAVGFRIENLTDDPIVLRGETSYLVTPDGQSQPLRSGTIAPHTWAAFSVPPLERTYRRRGGVSLGFGVGTFGSSGGGFAGVGYDPFYDDFAYAPDERPTWTWREGRVRLHLEFERRPPNAEAVAFAHEFVIERRKMAR